MKIQGNKELTISYLKNIKNSWDNVIPLIASDYDALKTMVERISKNDYSASYEELSNYGEYQLDFLTLAIELLMVQEETNRSMVTLLINF
jgi:hypothetical protein